MRNGFFNYPRPTQEKNQRSIGVDDLFLTRFTAPWARPASLPADAWRRWVLTQPVAVVCRETLIATLLSLDWKITPRNSDYREELEETIKYYTKLFTNGGEYDAIGLDYTGLIEWIAGDLLDTPFGGGAELGRRGNEPGGRVAWIRPLDAGTLYPTLNGDFPVVQMYMLYEAVAFPRGFISRTFMSPHSFLLREGWGMAPPEKVYFALEMLNRGDKYYANLLLDIPTAGILDLGDISKDDALEWATSFKSFADGGNVSFRIPVLYEHNNPVEFISLGKVPNDIMFNQITMKYAALVAAAYGMSLSDIGLQTTSASGETLAGSIRQERRTKKTGFARIKAKIKFFFDKILPGSLEFNFIDYDDELNVALGRARLASSQAFSALRQMGLFSPQELRSQWIQDGLGSIAMPDQLPPDAKPDPIVKPNAVPGLLQGGKAPSAGGEGEVKSLDSVSFKSKTSTLNNSIEKIVTEIAPKIYEALSGISEDEIDLMRSMVLDSVFSEEDNLELGVALSGLIARKSFGEFAFGKLDAEFEALLDELGISDVNTKSHVTDLKKNIREGFSEFIGRAVVYVLTNSEHLLSGDFESLVQDVQFKIHKSLTEYVSAHVGMEVQKTISEINNGQKELPEILRIKSIMKIQQDVPVLPPPVAPVINFPEITVNVPDRQSTFNISNPSPAVNVSVPAQDAPNITVNVPEQDAPTINVNIPDQLAPIVNLSVPEQATPIVNVENRIEPSKVEIVNPITVNVPKATREVQVIHRDNLGNIKYTDKDILYDEDKPE